MKIQAFMPVFNEADILPHTLRHLHEQGCEVHVIDGWSTDGSYEIADFEIRHAKTGAPFRWATVERFPARQPSPLQVCRDILARIEDLAAGCDADWCLYTDADEWRRSAVAGETLAQMCERIDGEGFNAVDHQVFQFYCINDDWDAARRLRSMASPENFFRYYDQADCISRIPNRKFWKNVGRVCLGGGGHEIIFPGMRAIKAGVMKHYPFRTPQQAHAKIELRRARRCHEEHAKGWGVHYDQYPPDFPFCWRPEDLKFWRDTRSPLP